MNDVLARIVEATREDLRDEWVDWKAVTRAARSRSETKPRYSFRSAISVKGGSPRVIAEIKAASPSAGVIAVNPDVAAIASAYRDGGAAAISVVTEPHFFAGSREWLYRAGKASGLPVIMKDFIVEPVQIFRGIAAGADAVLLLASILDPIRLQEFVGIIDELGRDAVVEVHDEEELLRALTAGARIIGVNNRDLRDFRVTLETSEKLGPLIPDDRVKVAESGIRSRADIARLTRAGFDAFLVGESLLRSEDREQAVRELVGKDER